jgi:hypothetical protein
MGFVSGFSVLGLVSLLETCVSPDLTVDEQPEDTNNVVAIKIPVKIHFILIYFLD